MKILILLGLIVLSSAQTLKPTLRKEKAKQWVEYKNAFNKQYEEVEEELKRMELFSQKLSEIETHNEKFARGESTYQQGINQFSDMTQEEIQALLTLKEPNLNNDCTTTAAPTTAAPTTAAPVTDCTTTGAPTTKAPTDELDYRPRITAVRSQGSCGSCWAFSSVKVTEGNLCVFKGANKDTLNLSEQQLVDCDTRNSGCSGGWPKNAMSYIGDNGLCSESNYPYTAKDGTCSLSGTRIGNGGTAGYTTSLSESAFKKDLKDKGLIGLAIDASSAFMSYSSGVFDGVCSSSSINHAVTLVGYHNNGQIPTWIVENSWGTGWGNKGFFEFKRGINKCNCEKYGMYYNLN